jgi:hypothetical protein
MVTVVFLEPPVLRPPVLEPPVSEPLGSGKNHGPPGVFRTFIRVRSWKPDSELVSYKVSIEDFIFEFQNNIGYSIENKPKGHSFCVYRSEKP